MFLIQKVEEVVVSYDDGRRTIVRFARTLGYEGWKDLKKDLIRKANMSGRDNDLRMHTLYVLTLCSQERLYTKIADFSTEESRKTCISYS